jgi:hypothetical protein
MHSAGNNLGGTGSASFACKPNLSQASQPLREIRQDFGGHLAAPAPGAQNARER